MALVLVAAVLVFLPSAEGLSAPQELSPAGGDHPSFLEVGEAAPAAAAAAKARIADAIDPTKQNTLKVIEKLMEAPIIDPRQEKAYKTAAVTVDKVKANIKNDLMKVVQMEILSQRVNELDAKKAMGIEGDVDNWLKKGGAAMETAIKSGSGCEDSHPGLCAGVQVQGHCGIKDYQRACPLSCHLCAMPPTFRLQNADEAKEKKMQERAGKSAATVAKEKDNKKIARAAKAYYAIEGKAGKARSKVRSLARKIGSLKSKLSTGKAQNERELKRSQVEAAANQAKAKGAKEAVAKAKKLKVVKGKADKSQIKSTKMLIKDQTATLKDRKKGVKKSKSNTKKDEKALDALEKKKAKYDGSMDYIRQTKKEIHNKRMENVKAKATVRMGLDQEQHKRELALETEKAEDKVADARMLVQDRSLKKKARKLYRQQAVANGEREKLEVVSKEEQKRIQQFTVPGAERKIKGELSRADRDMLDTKRKMDNYRVKYAHLGLKLKIPAKLEHAYAVAKASKTKVEELIKQLDQEQQSPAATKLKEMEVVAKGKFKKEEEIARAIKKSIDGEKKQVALVKKADKKRREMNKKAFSAAVKGAKAIADKADKAYKAGKKKLAKARKGLTDYEKKIAKDAVEPSQVLGAEETVAEDKAATKRAEEAVERSDKSVLDLKQQLGKVTAAVEKRKEEIKKEYAQAKANKAQDLALLTARAEKATAAKKSSKQRLKGVKDVIVSEHKLESAVMKTESNYEKAEFEADAIESRLHTQKRMFEDAKNGEPADIEEAKKKGVEKEKEKEEAAAEKAKAAAKAKAKVSKSAKKKAEISQSTKEMILAAKQAMAEAGPAAVAAADEKCTGSEDKHPKLCATIKNHKHCGFATYKDYCCGSCGSNEVSSLVV